MKRATYYKPGDIGLGAVDVYLADGHDLCAFPQPDMLHHSAQPAGPVLLISIGFSTIVFFAVELFNWIRQAS